MHKIGQNMNSGKQLHLNLPKIDPQLFVKIQERVKQGYISVRPHPRGDLFIYNYTTKTQIDSKWDEATMASRGLIVDRLGSIIARPFEKFFNVGQIEIIRNRTSHLYGYKWKDFYSKLHTEPFRAYPKLDGSLGVVYFNPYLVKWEIATRGSFESDQAVKGNELLKKYPTDKLNSAFTYLVEIVYPENRIVVDYKNREFLGLLSTINTAAGQDDWTEFNNLTYVWEDVVESLDGVSYLAQLNSIEEKENEEGYVLVYPTLRNFRMKHKFSEYCRLHKIMTGVTRLRIWEQLKSNSNLSEWLDKVPDEFYNYVMEVAESLKHEYAAIDSHAKAIYNGLKPEWNRKQIAQYLQDYEYRSLVFSMLDKKDYSQVIWGMIRPRESKIDE